MNVQEYIQSGVIEDYCLGLLSPQEMEGVAKNAAIYADIRHEIDEYQDALRLYAIALTEEKPETPKMNLMGLLDNLEAEESITAENLPLINKYSDAENWLRFVKPMLPATLKSRSIVHPLPTQEGVEQFVYWTYEDVPHESHHDEQETILLLEGECRCYIDDEPYDLKAGDFLSVPLYKTHNVEITKGPVMAIVQRVKVA